jgi:hypothetical protein
MAFLTADNCSVDSGERKSDVLHIVATTCTIITGEPNELAQIHPRMPVILPPATSRGPVSFVR